MTTRRYTVEDINQFNNSNKYLVISINVSDKFGDSGMAYSQGEIDKYKKYYAKKMGMEYFFDLFSDTCRDYYVYFFKNYQKSKYYDHIKKTYYYLLK